MELNTRRRLKRVMDIFIVILAGLILLPLIIITIILVWLTSKGPVFFSQERVGYKQKPFMIWKFRSMHISAEHSGPQLSSDDDERVTGWGRIMRKWRLDELPQIWNVLRGDMSIVGPRPERKFFIDQIIVTHPEYLKLLEVKPGLTSLGMVKFGYAENVKEMIERMKYDLEYAQHPSLLTDIKIMFLSVKVIFGGKGK